MDAATRLFKNGRIFTSVGQDRALYESMAISAGKVVEIGSEQTARTALQKVSQNLCFMWSKLTIQAFAF